MATVNGLQFNLSPGLQRAIDTKVTGARAADATRATAQRVQPQAAGSSANSPMNVQPYLAASTPACLQALPPLPPPPSLGESLAAVASGNWAAFATAGAIFLMAGIAVGYKWRD